MKTFIVFLITLVLSFPATACGYFPNSPEKFKDFCSDKKDAYPQCEKDIKEALEAKKPTWKQFLILAEFSWYKGNT